MQLLHTKFVTQVFGVTYQDQRLTYEKLKLSLIKLNVTLVSFETTGNDLSGLIPFHSFDVSWQGTLSCLTEDMRILYHQGHWSLK